MDTLRPPQKVSTQRKDKLHPIRDLEGPDGEYRYSCTLSLNSAPDGSDQSHAPAALNPGKRPGNHCPGGWVGPRVGVDNYGKSRSLTRIRSPDSSSRSDSLYRLSYRGPKCATRILSMYSQTRSRDSVVSIGTRYGPEGPGIESRWGEIFRPYPDWLRGPPSLLYNGYRVFPGGKGGRGVMLTTHPLLVPKLRKSWAIPPITPWVLLGLLRGYLYLLQSNPVITTSVYATPRL